MSAHGINEYKISFCSINFFAAELAHHLQDVLVITFLLQRAYFMIKQPF